MRTEGGPGPEIWLRGPVDAETAEPEAVRQQGGLRHAAARRYSWVGTHGGAGVSTLAAVYGGHDCGRDWPGPDAPHSVLLVARTHAAGLAATLRAVEVFRRGEAPAGLDLDAVVLVADAPGRLPRPLVHRVSVIESVIDVYRVPWVHAWRLGEPGTGPPRGTEPLVRLTGAATSR
ncbi:hypothetical protein GR925_02670 [Streptomyces sp. HUCO-GS316]|uniref:DUF6668 family protein n=1 Tax=Streptomyces sp. HUCO-GS316 TaxID=2692198 RepID=UPI00136A9B7C|nr:DUF6668 family protein [Streptomyces sp. HUCO-GS316]MXM62378.1 hypothetical protein [Streptomyces sp. HUCO-GS316]